MAEPIELSEPSANPEIDTAIDNLYADADATAKAEEAESGKTPEAAEETAPEETVTVEGADEASAEVPPEEDGEEPAGDEAAGEKPAEEAKLDLDQFEDPEAEIKPDKVSDDGKTLFFRREKAHRLMEANQNMKAIREAVPNATVETITEHYKTQVVFNEMVDDVNSGEPERIGKFLDFWYSPKAAPEAVMATVAALPEHLARTNPQALGLIEQQTYHALVQRLYREAKKSGDDQELALAQRLQQKLEGRFVNQEDLAKQGESLDERRALENERRQFNQDKNREAYRRMNEWLGETDKVVTSAVDGAIDEALAPVMEHLKDTPQLNWIRRDLRDKVDEAASSHTDWTRQFNNHRNQAARNPSEQTRRDLAAMKKQFAVSVIRKHLKPVIEAATGTVLSRSAKAHEKQKAAQGKRAASPSGQPTQRGVDLAAAVKSGKIKTQEDAWKAVGF